MPRLTVVVVTADDFDSVRRTVRALQAQTIAGDIELILVALTKEALCDHRPEELDGFARVEVVPIGRVCKADRGAASGIRRATAPLVACVENHAYPEPRWAEEIVQAHQGPWAVVGGLMVNSNPRSAVSWANMFMSHLDELVPQGGESKRPTTCRCPPGRPSFPSVSPSGGNSPRADGSTGGGVWPGESCMYSAAR